MFGGRKHEVIDHQDNNTAEAKAATISSITKSVLENVIKVTMPIGLS